MQVDKRLYWKCLLEFARAEERAGRFSRALKFVRAARGIAECIFGDQDIFYAGTLMHEADLLTTLELFDEAESKYCSCVRIFEREFGRDGLITALCLRNLSELYWAMGCSDKALAASLEARRSILGVDLDFVLQK